VLRSRVENVPLSTTWLLTELAEARGRQALFTRQAPQILKALREAAMVQSVESSNRMEGVEVAPERLRPLVLGKAQPTDRSEAELYGYRDALAAIHADANQMAVAPETVLRFHRMLHSGSAGTVDMPGDAGQWKRINNEILELRPGQAPFIRFKPMDAAETPQAMADLCRLYRHALDQTKLPELLADALLILDFLCIHPFRDGNGRVSRLLTLLLLYQHGYEVGRYISLERLVEDAKVDYYDVLYRSSQGWHEGKHDWLPWVNFYLGILHRAYRQFEQRVGDLRSPRGSKRAMVEAAVANFTGDFSLARLREACPGVSHDMVRKVLKALQSAGRVECQGRGPGAVWRKKG
jgi:Fic family protein